jgi:serine phosphatase RsbU (regulator of sigma subunit)
VFYKKPIKLHGIGKIQYPSRAIGIALAAIVYALNENQYRPLDSHADIIMISAAIVYPQLALYIYWKTNCNRKIETNMLLVDAFFSGVAMPFMGFNLLPSITLGSFTAAGTMVAKGYKHFLKGIISIGAGILFGCLLLGFAIDFQFHNEFELIVTICIFIIIYTSIFAFSAHQFVLKIINHKRLIHQQQELIEEQHKDILDSINYAQRIQNAILPSDAKWEKCLPNSFVLYKPKAVVAGDFYWLVSKGDELLFAAADCTGHGVPGAMISVVCSNGLNRSIREYGLSDPGKILTKVREIVVEELTASDSEIKDGMDIAICNLKLQIDEPASEQNLEDKVKGILKFAGANNPLWIFRKNTKTLEEIKGEKQPIGLFESSSNFQSHQVELFEGDTIYIFSDGFADQFGGADNKKYKSKRFKEFLLSIQEKSMTEQKLALEDEFSLWRGEMEQLDDICVIGVRF